MALGHAHNRGIVHRDVKPANIMLDSDGRVVLTDFGISKALDSGSALTGTGNIIGTPHYMAPEQAKGLDVDGRVDQYALAVVGHQILTGKQPFEGSSHSILYKHVFEAPPRIFENRPDAPADLCAALDRALSKEPANRFPGMEEFAVAVSGERTGPRTLVSAAVTPSEQQVPTKQRLAKRRVIARRGLIAAGFCAALVGVAWAAWLPFQEPPHPRVTSKPAPPRGTATGVGSGLPEPAEVDVGGDSSRVRRAGAVQAGQEGIRPADGHLGALGNPVRRQQGDRADPNSRLSPADRDSPHQDPARGISHPDRDHRGDRLQPDPAALRLGAGWTSVMENPWRATCPVASHLAKQAFRYSRLGLLKFSRIARQSLAPVVICARARSHLRSSKPSRASGHTRCS